jgi:hypothetical protein
LFPTRLGTSVSGKDGEHKESVDSVCITEHLEKTIKMRAERKPKYLQKNMIKHSDEKSYQCDVCNKGFK